MEFYKIIIRGHLVQVFIPTDIKEALRDKGRGERPHIS